MIQKGNYELKILYESKTGKSKRSHLAFLAGAKNGRNFGLKTCWAKFQLWSSIDSFLSGLSCFCFCFVQKRLFCKIGFGLTCDHLAETLPTYFLYS